MFISPGIFVAGGSSNEVLIYSPLTPKSAQLIHSDYDRDRKEQIANQAIDHSSRPFVCRASPNQILTATTGLYACLNNLRRLFAVILVVCVWHAALAAGSTFTYEVTPYCVVPSGSDLVVSFNVWKGGDPFTIADFRFSKDSKWRSLIENRMKLDDLMYSYFEIVTAKKIQRLRGMPFVSLDIVTKDVLRDISENSKWRRESGIDRVEVLTTTDILSMRSISQNEFLHINPKIVPDPTKQK